MGKNDDIYLLTADLGMYVLDNIKKNFPERFFNTGAAEQLLVGAAIGLAENKKIAIAYTITPFVILRPFEMLRTYVNHESIPVKLVGCGRDKDYVHDGISHWAHDDEAVLAPLKNIKFYKPETDEDLVAIFHEYMYSQEPCYLNLKR